MNNIELNEIEKIQKSILTLVNTLCEDNLNIEFSHSPIEDDDDEFNGKTEYYVKITNAENETIFENTWID